MLRHKKDPFDVVADVFQALRPYTDQLATDPKLRFRLAKPIQSGTAARPTDA